MMSHQYMTEQEIRAAEQRCQQATKGPYRVVYNGNSLMAIATDYARSSDNENVALSPLIPKERHTYFQSGERQAVTFEMFSHARTDLPRALADLRELRRVVRELAESVQPFIDFGCMQGMGMTPKLKAALALAQQVEGGK